jgi:opacity protein-like surface antigen
MNTVMPSIAQTLSRPALAGALLVFAAMPQAYAEESMQQDKQQAEDQGFYATIGVGAAWPQNVTGNSSLLGIDVNGEYSLGGGFAGELGAGYDFGVVRAELTYLYNHATLNSLNATALGQSITASISDGGINTNSVMASAYFDIPTNSRFVPYVGGGLGYTNVSWGGYSASAAGVTLSQTSGSQGVFGYQGKVGVSYLASKTTDLFVEATYQGAAGFTVDSVNYDPLSSWGARLGARYRF